MPEPFKNYFSVELIEQMAACFARAEPAFNPEAFISEATQNLDKLELKQRSEGIVKAMQGHLPSDFARTCYILKASLKPMTNVDEVNQASEYAHLLSDWAIMPMADYVAVCGQADFSLAMQLLCELTQRFTAEFAIRHFIIAQQEQSLKYLQSCVMHSSKHVRRLVSEGTRPRLPWGIQLKAFINDPTPILPLLEALKDDESEYVRRSVANNLNDIAKDHPQLVVKLCKRWLNNASDQRVRLIRHACRTLFKKGMPEALALFGYLPPQLVGIELRLSDATIKHEQSIDMHVSLRSGATSEQEIMLDYVVYYQKANAKLLPKVFKWKSLTLAPNESVNLSKSHSFKSVTTRKHYSGEHRISLLLNGKEFASQAFHLV